MPFSFPSSPSVGATSTQNGRSYTYAGNSVWELTATGGGSGSVVTAETVSAFPGTGSSGVVYVATDTARAYIWAGSYIELGVSGGGTDTELRALFTPGAPTSVTATGGNAQVALSWSAPTVSAQTPITDYTVQFSSNSGSSWTNFTRAASTATSATVTSLTNGTAYTFRVAAVNGVGTGSYSTATSAVTPAVPNLSATLTSGGGLNSWRWNPSFGTGTTISIGRFEDGTNIQGGWRTTFTPASKPSSISSAIFTLAYNWDDIQTAFTAVLRGAKLANAGQGLQGTSPTTASATGNVATGNGTLTIDCTAVIAEIIGQADWTPGNSIVLYLSGENSATERSVGTFDTAGSLVINYA
jgi:titin